MRLILVVGLISACYGLYEDQIGKFDWRKQYVGCPEKAIFHSTSKSEQVIVSTRENIFASLSAANGDINWRRIQENHQGSSLVPSGSKRLYSVSDGGRAVRAWNAFNGALVWQKSVCDAVSSSTHLAVSKNANQEIVAYGCGHVFTFSSAGDELSKVYVGTSGWSRVVSEGGNIYHLSISNGVLTVNAISGGKVAAKKTLSIKSNNGEKCHLVGIHVVCSHSDDVFSINVAADNLIAESLATGISIRDIVALDDSHIVVRSSQDTIILSLQSGLKQVLKIQKRLEAVTFVANKVVSIVSGMISVYDLSNGKDIFVKPLPTHTTNAAQAISLFANERKQNIELLIVFADCRTEMLEISLTASTLESEWHREEGLARVASVEMVDLPLSEQQQLIEDEFDQEGDNMISSLIHRTVSQMTQLQRWLINSIHQVVTVSSKLSGKTSFSQIMDTIKSSSKTTSAGPLERDFFNLRKMLVVASLDGVIFGIDSADGSVVWKTYLGSSFTPLSNSLGDIKVPLFIQRSTANYHLQGQAAVGFKDSFSHRSVLVFFNPITGVIVQRKALDSAVKRIDMLPFIGKDHIHSLIVVDENDKVSFHPELPSDMDVSYPVFLLSHSNTAVEGKQVNLRTGALETLWNANLHLTPNEKIIVVKGKPASQRVHSQGRVLIDRNVQYKYSNPNLVVVASLDTSAQLLTIYLLDSVSGQIVHTAKLQKAGGPVHLVHCENWIAYSYWSEKARRTELGIIELYEGDTQSNKDKFDSLSPTERAPEVTSQSYVYAQGVDAMAVTETEQGLTTRAIVLALPFGGIHEVSRKFLDANRPLELTQEMREEMMIPYMPEIPIATEEMVNYNQTVFRVRGIKTAMSGLESTSLMLAYGVDLFFTRLHPSGTFDILKDDFDHVLISLVLLGLFVGSFISKRIARNNALKASWA